MRKVIIEKYECETCNEQNDFNNFSKCRFCGVEICDSCSNPGFINGQISYKLLHCENPECGSKAVKENN